MTGYGLVQAKDAYDYLEEKGCGGVTGSSDGVGGCQQLEIACSSNSECDDDDSCTNDICLLGSCVHEPACSLCGKKALKIDILNDYFPNEVNWEVNFSNDQLIASGNSGSEPNAPYTRDICLSDGEHAFIIQDSAGDGICCTYGDGKYSLFIEGTKIVERTGDFGSNDIFSFTVGEDFTSAPTASPTPCTGSTVMVQIQTDQWPSDTSWDIFRASDNEIVGSGGEYSEANEFYETSLCLQLGSYIFTIYDFFSDGLCCDYGDGWYKVIVDKEEVISGGDFKDGSESTSFEVTNGIVPTSAPTRGNCKPFVFKLTTDRNGAETSAALVGNDRRSYFIAAPGSYQSSKSYEDQVCLEDGEYYFTIFDNFGDGICCKSGSGAYTLLLDGKVVKEGGNFESSEKSFLNVGGEKCKAKGELCNKKNECCSKKCKGNQRNNKPRKCK